MNKIIGFGIAAGFGLMIGAPAQTPGPTPAAPPDNAFFAGPGTMGASLNGHPLLPGTAVLGGETVTTGPNGVAILAPTHGAGGVLELTANASATVQPGAVTGAADQLQMSRGNALVTGTVTVETAQGEVFQPQTKSTQYVVNAGDKQASMGVLAGGVNTYNTRAAAAARVVPQGQAVTVQANASGQYQLNPISPSAVTKPAPNAAVVTQNSETSGGGGA